MKPLTRGYSHQIAFFMACLGCSLLIMESQGERALTANIIYSLSLAGLYGISALYHGRHWSRKIYLVMKRIDHAAIFSLIAGTATPICLLGMKTGLGFPLLVTMWFFAGIGMLITLFWIRAPKWFRALIYVAIGWLAVPFLYEIEASMGTNNLYMLLLGGISYTVGALVYAFKWPDPFPKTFGYHEIFHLFVVIGSAFHFMLVYWLTI